MNNLERAYWRGFIKVAGYGNDWINRIDPTFAKQIPDIMAADNLRKEIAGSSQRVDDLVGPPPTVPQPTPAQQWEKQLEKWREEMPQEVRKDDKGVMRYVPINQVLDERKGMNDLATDLYGPELTTENTTPHHQPSELEQMMAANHTGIASDSYANPVFDPYATMTHPNQDPEMAKMRDAFDRGASMQQPEATVHRETALPGIPSDGGVGIGRNSYPSQYANYGGHSTGGVMTPPQDMIHPSNTQGGLDANSGMAGGSNINARLSPNLPSTASRPSSPMPMRPHHSLLNHIAQPFTMMGNAAAQIFLNNRKRNRVSPQADPQRAPRISTRI